LAALAGIARAGVWTPSEARPADVGPAVRGPLATTEAWTEYTAKRLLEAAGIQVTREAEADSVMGAIRAAEELGYPVVLKASSASLTHKTEAGAVRLHLSDGASVEFAAEELLGLAPRVLVAEQLDADLELVVGAFIDEQFGPCGLVGLGGVWTEAFQEAVVIAAPGSRATFDAALQTRPWGRLLLEGGRGREFPVGAVWHACARLVALLEAANGKLTTIEVNPMFLVGDRAVAVDALVVPSE
jgi:succinyl-CoA synthetase beta subunit